MAPLPKIIIILALWLLYCFVLFQACSDTLCLGCLGDGATTGAVVPGDSAELALQRYPIDFRWSDPTPNTNPGYEERKRAVLADRTGDNILEITGLYYEEESPPAGFDNMGFARAEQLRQLIAPDLPAERVRLKARLIDEREGVREGYFEGGLFRWEAPEETVAETVEELEDRVNIRFPYNSTEREYNPEVEEYLKRLAETVRQTGGRIRLTGHTDNSGADEYNQELGMRRARQIQSILTGLGVPAAQIEVISRGEGQPIASNDTEEGRHENRRVEVRLLPQ